MGIKRSWQKEDLIEAVKSSTSIRNVIKQLGLIPAGGNYAQIKKYLAEYKIQTFHFKGKCWNKGLKGIGKPRIPLEKILTENNDYQSYKLKRRLISTGLKENRCENCGWAELSGDGRIPLELDHINGDRRDNRLENLRILCPNCHSLRSNHRGRARKTKGRWRNRYTLQA